MNITTAAVKISPWRVDVGKWASVTVAKKKDFPVGASWKLKWTSWIIDWAKHYLTSTMQHTWICNYHMKRKILLLHIQVKRLLQYIGTFKILIFRMPIRLPSVSFIIAGNDTIPRFGSVIKSYSLPLLCILLSMGVSTGFQPAQPEIYVVLPYTSLALSPSSEILRRSLS